MSSSDSEQKTKGRPKRGESIQIKEDSIQVDIRFLGMQITSVSLIKLGIQNKPSVKCILV